MKRWLTSTDIKTPRLTDHCQQLTNPIITLGLPPVADFSGAGRRRSEIKSAIVEEEDRQDRETAERLERLAVNAYQSAAEISVIDILSEGAIFENRGRPLRQLPIFYGPQRAKRAEAWAVLSAWQHKNRGVRIIHIRARLKGGAGQVPVHQLRDGHMSFFPALSEDFSYGCRASGAEALAIGKHHGMLQRGWLVDMHGHLEAAFPAGANVERLQKYMSDRYDCYFEIIEDDGAAGLASYLRNSTARHVADIEDEYLVEYIRQVEKLHLFEFLGPARKLKSALGKAGYRAIVSQDKDGHDHVAITPVRRRNPTYRRSLTQEAGPVLCRTDLAWIKGELRPALIVSGWNGDWKRLCERYDLAAVIAEARKAFGNTYTCNTVTSEFSSPASPKIDSSPQISCEIRRRQDDLAVPW